MPIPHLASLRPSRLALAAALAFVLLPAAHADSDAGRETLGIESALQLPAHAHSHPPSWAGKAFRHGVVSVANPYGAEAGAQLLEQGATRSTPPSRSPMRSTWSSRNRPASAAAASC